jgi:nicotinate dehydrogenase subunit B
VNQISEFLKEDRQHDSIHRLAYAFDLERRDFLKLLGGGVMVGLCTSSAAQESGGPGHQTSEDIPNSLAAWIHIGEDDAITVCTGKVEIGQNIRTSLAQQVAEELRVPILAIHLVMADTALTPFDAGTFGSRTTPIMGHQLRNAAAAARELLIEMAAKRWQSDPANLTAADGKILDTKTKQSISYGALTKGQQLAKTIASDPPLAPAKVWKIAGTPVPKVDGMALVTGSHRYTSDLTCPGMLYGKVLRPDAFRATLISLDADAAQKISGAKVVRDGDFVGIAAADEYTANRALSTLCAQWKTTPQSSESELYDYLRKNPEPALKGEGRQDRHVSGSIRQGFVRADHTLAQTYTVAYIAHVPLEPRAALAEWNGDNLTVWTGTQRPFAVRHELAQAFRVSLERVRVIVPDTGSAYGGKHMGDAAVEAARLSKAVGKPVKLVWSREEEFTWAYFRPAGVIDVKSGVRRDGTLLAWQFDNYNSGPAAISTPYHVPNQQIEFHPSDSPLRQGSYRGLAATANHFARETHMDELAHLLAMDPLEFRLKNLRDPRLRAVFETAATKFGWARQRSSATRGFGIAGGVEKGGYVAACAEVAIDPSTRHIRIVRVVEAFECGAIVNPNGLRNQIEGAMVEAIGGALFEAVHFENGRILNPHLADYRVPRFSDLPRIEVETLDRKDLPPAGAGETPLVGLAPAVGNAIFAATGIRLRALPLIPDGLSRSSSEVKGS